MNAHKSCTLSFVDKFSAEVAGFTEVIFDGGNSALAGWQPSVVEVDVEFALVFDTSRSQYRCAITCKHGSARRRRLIMPPAAPCADVGHRRMYAGGLAALLQL